MKSELLRFLGCPSCNDELRIIEQFHQCGEIVSGILQCVSCEGSYKIENYIPRFVPRENYAGNFGFQWQKFRKTQLDCCTGLPISTERFWRSTRWSAEELNGKIILDVGCGAGRFAEVSSRTNAIVIALDYSSAIDACRENLCDRANIHFVQGSVYELPFRRTAIDYVYCLGVVQHTPDVEATVKALAAQIEPRGKLAIDIYAKTWWRKLAPVYLLRRVLNRKGNQKLLGLVETMVKYLLPISDFLSRIPLLGRKLRWLVPVSNYRGVLPLNDEQLKEWAVLDTFDILSAQYDQPQTMETVRNWLTESGVTNVDVFSDGGPIIAVGEKKDAQLRADK